MEYKSRKNAVFSNDGDELLLQNDQLRVQASVLATTIVTIITVANIQNATNKIRTCTEPKFKLCGMKLCCSDNN